MPSARRKLTPIVVAAALALAGCGSTLQPTAQTTVVSEDGLATSAGEATVSGAVTDDGLGGSAAAPGQATTGGGAANPTRSSVAPRAGGSTAATGPAAGTPTGQAGPAAAATAATGPVKVGVVGVDVTALFVVFGAQGNSDSIFTPYEKMFEYINKTGGVAGRQLEMVKEQIDVAEDQNAAAQRVCESFIEKKVEFVIPGGGDVFLTCLRKAGIPAFGIGSWVDDRGTLNHPNWFVPFGLPVDRYIPDLIDFGIEQGFLKKGETLGVLYEDCPWGQRVYNGPVKAKATQHGLKTVPATTKCIENLVSDLGPVTNQVQQAALRFNSSGATHVLTVTAAEGFYIGQFQQAAVQQQYHPKYFFTSNGFPFNNTHPDSAVQWQHSELPNMLGLGNLPYIDVGFAAQPANDAQAAAQAKCREADPQTGQGDGSGEEQARAQATEGFYALCDVFFLIRGLADANGGRFDIQSLTSVYRSTIGSLPSASLTGGRYQLSGRRLEGSGFHHPIKFGANEKPMYFGSLRPVP